MADNNVEQNPLQPPLQPGVDHSSFNKLPEVVGKEIGLPAQALAPTDKTAQDLAEANVADYLEKMGAKIETEAPVGNDENSTIGDFGEAVKSILPGGDDNTVRFVSGGVGNELVKAKTGDQEEKKAA